MGLAKAAWIESQERGWDAPDAWVCSVCVGDEFLANLVLENVEECECSYCGEESAHPVAAPVECVMEVIAAAVFHYFSPPQEAGVPYEDGEWAVRTLDTADVIAELELDAQDQFLDDVISAFHEVCWVRSSAGFWAAPRTNQRLKFAWQDFVRMVKHQTRFHFLAQKEDGAYEADYLTPDQILSEIAELLRKFEMLRQVPEGTPIYRCRTRQPHDNWTLNEEQLGAPPSERASAGRMNPAGISYFYGAFAIGTAVGEIVSHPPTAVGIGTFVNTHPLLVADLTKLPPIPSIFDSGQRNEREALLFLREFTRQISRPVKKDGTEHIDYVPSQVVCEYLAQVFEIDSSGKRLEGIVFPSSIKPGCHNIVLFPSDRVWKTKFDRLRFVEGKVMHLGDWQSVVKALEMGG